MKQRLVIAACLLLMPCASYAQSFDVPADDMGFVENPSWNVKPELPSIDQIIFTSEKTQVFFKTYMKEDAWCNINPKTYIRCKPGGKVLKLVRAEGIALAPGTTYYRDIKTPICFNLTFPALPKGTTSFDIIESEISDWQFYNVRNEKMSKFANVNDVKNWRTDGKRSSSNESEPMANAKVEVPARYPGGETALLSFVSNNLEYPDTTKQGTVVLRFRVGVDGLVDAVKIEKSLSPVLDKAAEDVVRKLPRFIPAKTNGTPVPVWFRLPIRFRFDTSTDVK